LNIGRPNNAISIENNAGVPVGTNLVIASIRVFVGNAQGSSARSAADRVVILLIDIVVPLVYIHSHGLEDFKKLGLASFVFFH
jgi:hypothetical protein